MTSVAAKQRRLSAVADLVTLDAASWRSWLHFAVFRWEHAAHDGARSAAFSPIVMDPRDPRPPAQLARELRWTTLDPVREHIEAAIADEIATWSAQDDVGQLDFLLLLAGEFGVSALPAALRALLAREVHLDGQRRTRLAGSLAFAACRRLTPAEAHEVARRMQARHLLTPVAAAQLLAFAATRDPTELPDLVSELLPCWESETAGAPLARLLINHVVERLGPECAWKVATSGQSDVLLFIQTALQAHADLPHSAGAKNWIFRAVAMKRLYAQMSSAPLGDLGVLQAQEA